MSALLASRRRANADAGVAVPAAEVQPAAGWWEAAGASRRVTEDEIYIVQDVRLGRAYSDLVRQLERLGIPRDSLHGGPETEIRHDTGDVFYEALGAAFGGGVPVPRAISPPPALNRARVWEAIDRLRRERPETVRSITGTREEWERRILRRGEGRSRDQAVLERARGASGFTAVLAGGMVGSLSDPVNIATLPLGGGGGSVLRVAAREALINGLIETLQIPALASGRQRLGEELTASEAALNVAFAAAGGAVIGGVGRALAEPAAAVREAVLAQIYPHLPERIRRRYASIDLIPDDVLADTVEDMAGGNLTPEQRDAVATLRDMAGIEAANPFVRDPGGDAGHQRLFADVLARVIDENPASPIAPVSPRSAAASLSDRTAISTGTVATGPASAARETLRRRIRHAESSGNDGAANPRSSAYGRYQFTRATWINYYVRRFGRGGRTDDEIAALRRDGRLQDVLFDDLTADNARQLARIGEQETAGNLYLMHFAGRELATRILRAADDMPIERIASKQVLRANRFLRGMNAADVVAWAHRRMGDGPVPPRAGQRMQLADYDPEDAVQAAIQAELDSVNARMRALDAEAGEARAARDLPDAAGPAARLVDPVDLADDLADDLAGDSGPLPLRAADDGEPTVRDDASPAAHADSADPVPMAEAETPEARQVRLVEALQDIVLATNRSLADVARLARRLETGEADVRAAMDILAAQNMVVAMPDGRYARPPRRSRPPNAFEVISAAGGIRDKKMGNGRGMYDLMTRFAGKPTRVSRSGSGLMRQTREVRVRQSVMVPRFGPLIRRMDNPKAKYLDEVGELLFERGYLRGDTWDERPTEPEVLDYLERGLDDPSVLMPLDWAPDGPPVRTRPMSRSEIDIAIWSNRENVVLAEHEIDRMIDIIEEFGDRGIPMTAADAYTTMADRDLVDALIDIWEQASDDPDIVAAIAGVVDEIDGTGGAGRAADAANARPGGGGGGHGADGGADFWPAQGWTIADDLDRWVPADDGWRAATHESDGAWADSPNDWNDAAGSDARAQADSLAHDARATLDDSDMARIGILTDENGDVRNIADIMAEIDADEAMIRTLRDCL